MVGLFINTLPLRVQFERDDSALPLLKKLQAEQAEVSQYEHSPLAQVQAWSEIPRGMPLFESIVVFENYPLNESLEQGFGGLEIANLRVFERTNYPITFVAVPSSALSLMLLYDRSRFERATISRMLEHLKVILEAIVADPEQRVLDLPLLTEAERHQLILEWADTRALHSKTRCRARNYCWDLP
jgi:non-ribosomal peptide synthetase component F